MSDIWAVRTDEEQRQHVFSKIRARQQQFTPAEELEFYNRPEITTKRICAGDGVEDVNAKGAFVKICFNDRTKQQKMEYREQLREKAREQAAIRFKNEQEMFEKSLQDDQKTAKKREKRNKKKEKRKQAIMNKKQANYLDYDGSDSEKQKDTILISEQEDNDEDERKQQKQGEEELNQLNPKTSDSSHPEDKSQKVEDK